MKNILFIVVSLFIVSCTENKDKNDEQPPKQKELSAEIKAIIMKDYTDATELLSIKHKISHENSNKITLEYIKIFDPIMHRIISGIDDERIGEKILKPEESLPEFINRMTLLTGESSDKIASYVIDLKMYMKSMEENE